MHRTIFHALGCAAALLAMPRSLAAQPPARWEEPLATTENAALVYWQAIALIPKGGAEQQADFDNPDGMSPDAAAAKEAFVASGPAMRLMRHAAGLKQCDWGINRNDGPGALMPHAAKVRELTRMAMFHALFQARSNELDGAVEDGLAILSLSRHMSFDEMMIGTLTGYALEAQGVRVLAETIPQLSPAQLRSLAQRHASLPSRPPAREAILLEKRAFLGWFARAVKEGRSEEALDVAAVMAGANRLPAAGAVDQGEGTKETPWLAALRRIEEGKQTSMLLHLIRQAAPYYDEGAGLLDLPFDEFATKSAEWEASVKDRAHPLIVALLPPIGNFYSARLRVEARRAVVPAAIGYILEGESGLRKHSEPSTGKPFSLKKTPTGFELHSNLPDPVNQPLVVTFGRPVKTN